MFRKAHLHLTLFYSIFFFVLLWSFSIGIYTWMERSFGETYISRVKDLDAGSDNSDLENVNVSGYSNTVAIAGDVALQKLLEVLMTVNVAFLFLIPPVAWLLALRTLKPIRRVHEQQRQFVSDASHELRTPLAIILGETEMTLKRNQTTSGYKKALVSVNEEVQYLQSLVENLLMLSRLDQEQRVDGMTMIDLTDLVAMAVSHCMDHARHKNQKLHFEPPQSPILISGNEVLLLHLFQNLIENAIKYTQVHGKISVQLTLQSGTPIITVKDNGIGISSLEQKKVFQRFYQTDAARSGKKGYGLGLALCQSIVLAHHGTLRIDSALEKGTTIYVTLPLRK